MWSEKATIIPLIVELIKKAIAIYNEIFSRTIESEQKQNKSWIRFALFCNKTWFKNDSRHQNLLKRLI